MYRLLFSFLLALVLFVRCSPAGEDGTGDAEPAPSQQTPPDGGDAADGDAMNDVDPGAIGETDDAQTNDDAEFGDGQDAEADGAMNDAAGEDDTEAGPDSQGDSDDASDADANAVSEGDDDDQDADDHADDASEASSDDSDAIVGEVEQVQVEPAQDQEAEAGEEQDRGAVRHVEFLDETFPYDEAHPLVGFWHGNVETELGPLVHSIYVERDEAGNYSVASTLAKVSPPHLPAKNVVVSDDGTTLSYEAPATPVYDYGHFEFEGTVSEDGQWFEGSAMWPERLEEPGTFRMQRQIRTTDLDMIAWSGKVDIAEILFDINIVIAQTPGGNWVGHIDIPRQRVDRWPLVNVRRDGRSLEIEMGSRSPATYTGTISEDGSTWAGTYVQGDLSSEFEFTRNEEYKPPYFPVFQQPEPPQEREQPREAQRPQSPKEPFPYEVSEVIIDHPDGHFLGGSVFIPEGEGPFPGVVLISRSGAQQRHQKVAGHDTYYVLADHFARNGIAVLWYDDRGQGRSQGSHAQSTSRDFATDAQVALAKLQSNESVRSDAVGLLGMDEGGLIAPMVTETTGDVAFLVLLNAPGMKGAEMHIAQVRRMLDRRSDATPQQIEAVAQAQRKVVDMVGTDVSEEAFEEAITQFVRLIRMAQGENPDTGVSGMVRGQKQVLSTPWMQYFLSYDPGPTLEAIDIPVFAAAGALDHQMPQPTNFEALNDHLNASSANVTTKLLPHHNHLMQPGAQTGEKTEFQHIPITFDPELLNEMTGWMLNVTGSADTDSVTTQTQRSDPEDSE